MASSQKTNDQLSRATHKRLPLQTVYGDKTLFDLYQDYEKYLDLKDTEHAHGLMAKLKTALIRYTLPGWGLPIHYGKATASQTAAGIEFMKQVSLLQFAQALEVQEKTFRQLEIEPAAPISRINRSALNKLLEFGRSQPYWNTIVGSDRAATTPRMLVVTRNRCKHWHRLKQSDISPKLQADLEALMSFWQSQRQPALCEKTRIRYRREILDILGWLHQFQKVPIADLELHLLVPPQAIHHRETANQVRSMAEDYLEWVNLNVSSKFSTQRFAVQVLVYIAEYVEQTASASMQAVQNEQNLVIQVLTELRQDRKLNSQFPQTTRRKLLENYTLTAEQVTPELRQQLDEFYNWMTIADPRFSQQVLVKPKTALMRIEEIYRLLGWLFHYKGLPLEALSLNQLVTVAPIKTAYRSATRFEKTRQIEQAAEEAAEQTLMILNEHLTWQKDIRGTSAVTRRLVVERFTSIAKFLYRAETNCLKGRPYDDVPVVVALRKADRVAKEAVRQEPKAIDTSLKWLPWEKYLEMVRHLKQECQLHYSHGKKRSDRAIAKSIRRYLICAFFAYMPPDRQQTYRELQIGTTLVRGEFGADGFFKQNETGAWHIWLPPERYKTGKIYGEQWRVVPEILYPEIEAWLKEWRSVFDPQHDFFFTQEDGQPFSEASSFSSVIKHAATRITGKQLTSHLIRHMLVTYAQEQGASEAMLQSLAEAMLHSKETQERVYDQRSKLDRIAPAQQFVLNAAMGKKPMQDNLSVEHLEQAIRQLPPHEYARLMRSLKSPENSNK